MWQAQPWHQPGHATMYFTPPPELSRGYPGKRLLHITHRVLQWCAGYMTSSLPALPAVGDRRGPVRATIYTHNFSIGSSEKGPNPSTWTLSSPLSMGSHWSLHISESLTSLPPSSRKLKHPISLEAPEVTEAANFPFKYGHLAISLWQSDFSILPKHIVCLQPAQVHL